MSSNSSMNVSFSDPELFAPTHTLSPAPTSVPAPAAAVAHTTGTPASLPVKEKKEGEAVVEEL